MSAMRIIVNLPDENEYVVRVGSGQLASLGEALKNVASLARVPAFLVISDTNVAPLYGDVVADALKEAGYRVDAITIDAGEPSKSVEVAAEIWEAMAELGLSRDCAVVALGGGVVGDLAGFVASTFMRGIPVVQVPTTLLSMVDSSVGGKTAVNLESGKNLVGTFTQPAYVCASTDTLATLPEREWRCGCAEIAKCSVIDSDEFFFWMLSHATELAQRDEAVCTEAIKRSVVFKADVVAQDKTESAGIRECLNYGHTLAHAIESLAGYGTFSHGAAVAEGMRFTSFLGQRLIGTEADFAEAQASLLDDLELPYLDWFVDPQSVLQTMKKDKKARGGAVRFVLAKDVGNWVVEKVDDEVILEALGDYFALKRTVMEVA